MKKRFSHRHPKWKKIRRGGTIAVCELGGRRALALLRKAKEAAVGVPAAFSSGWLNISVFQIKLYIKKKVSTSETFSVLLKSSLLLFRATKELLYNFASSIFSLIFNL